MKRGPGRGQHGRGSGGDYQLVMGAMGDALTPPEGKIEPGLTSGSEAKALAAARNVMARGGTAALCQQRDLLCETNEVIRNPAYMLAMQALVAVGAGMTLDQVREWQREQRERNGRDV